MRLRFHGLTLTRFRSFRDTVEFRFGDDPGFFNMTGDNGSGKSSLWDGVCWVLYGKTTRGLKAGDVCSWGKAGGTVGQLTFTLGKKTCSVTRTWKPNSLVLIVDREERNVEQEEIDRLVGMNYDTFLNVVVLSQFGRYFFDLGATEKLQRFSDVLGLGMWLDVAERCGADVKKLKATIEDDEQTLARFHGRIDTLKEQRDRLKREQEEHDERHAQAVAQVKADRKAVVYDIDEAGRAAKEAINTIKECAGKIDTLQRELGKLDDEHEKIKAEHNGLVLKADRLERHKQETEKRSSDLHDHAGKKCPRCGQKITKAHADTEIKAYANEWELADKEHKRIIADMKGVEKRRNENRERHVAVCEALSGVESKHSKAKVEAGKLKAQLDGLKRQLDDHDRRLAELDKDADRYVKQIDDIRDDLEKTRGGRDNLKTQIAEAKSELEVKSYWLTGFKELRLWMVETALKELEISVNNSLIELGLDGWRIEFDVEKQTKSGTVSKEFHVLVYPPKQETPVRWESYSGGETQRLRIAGAVGLVDMICSRLGLNPPVEVWDEPTTFMTNEGVEDLLTFLDNRSRTLERQIWLVDHRAHTYNFDGEVRVLKTKKGSVIEG